MPMKVQPMNLRWHGWRVAVMAVALLGGVSEPIAADELETAMRQGAFLQAWELAQAQRPTREGEPAFDLLYATAALEAGQHGEAVFALDRLIVVDPANPSLRLLLARALYEAREYLRAEQEITALLARADLDAATRANAEGYRIALQRALGRYRDTAYGTMELSAGWDSNINTGPDGQVFDLGPPGTVDLGESGTATESSFLGLDAAAGLIKPVSPSRFVYLDGRAEFSAFAEDNALNTQQLALAGGYGGYVGLHRWRLGLAAERAWLDSDPYRNALLLSADWQHHWGPRHNTALIVQLNTLDYPEDTLRDSQGALLGVQHQWRLGDSLRSTILLRGWLGRDEAEDSSPLAAARASRDWLGLGLGYAFSPAAGWRLTAEASAWWSRYDEADPTTQLTREDDLYRLDVYALRRLSAHWDLRLGGRLEQRSSSIPYLEYDRSQVGVSVRYAF